VRVRFLREVMDTPERFGRDLNAIVDTFANEKHVWDIEDPTEVLTSRWVQGAPSWDNVAELAKKSFRASIDAVPRGRLLIVALGPESDPLMNSRGADARRKPDAARKLLEDPAYIVLENASADWQFLRAMASAFGRIALLSAMNSAWIIPEHAGGSGEFLKRVDALLARGVVRWRVAVLCDSDRLTPGALPPKVQRLVAELAQRNVVAFVLHKREIENYLPDDLIDDPKHHDRFVSLQELTRVQRDHFDMKLGFRSQDGSAQIPTEQTALFKDANPWHLNRLVGGFGKNVGDRFKSSILREDLTPVCDTKPGELEGILDDIEEML
jgi:hypothetical protein